MSVSVRAAVPTDARAIAEIHIAGWRAAYRGHMPDAFLDALSLDERSEKRRLWLEKPASPELRTWVAEGDARIVGWANTGPSRGEAMANISELYAIYLDPAHWRRGIGRTLHDFAIDDLRRRGTTEVTLWVLDGNAPARRFYETLGWRVDGGEKSEVFGGTSVREVRYRLVL